MATSKNGSTYPNTSGHNVKTADIILSRAEFHRGTKSIEDIIKSVGHIEYVDEGAETSQDTHERASRMLRNMDAIDVMMYLNEEVTPGSHYKRRACVKHAITRAAAAGDYKEVGKLTMAYIDHYTPPLKTRRSKQADNQYIKAGWRDIFITRLAKRTSEHKAAALISYLTGARPHEFAPKLGVTVYLDGDVVTIEIMGAKVKKGNKGEILTGVPSRRMKFKLDNHTDPALRMLVELIPPGEKKLEVKFDKASTLRSQKNGLYQLIAGCGEGLTGGIFSSYNLRHLFASNLKTSVGSDSKLVSIALGHISTKTKKYYGRARSHGSGGGIVPTAVASTHQPRTPGTVTQVAPATPTAPVVVTPTASPAVAAPTAAAVVAPVVVKPVRGTTPTRKKTMKM
jgi:integrase